jgi:anti-sigma regulatory factor (Ser/Thr protein kinase)
VNTQRRARRVGARLALIYATASAIWIVSSDLAVEAVLGPGEVGAAVNAVKGVLFVAVTATLLYIIAARYLDRLYESQAKHNQANEALLDREQSIQQAYVDVIDAVTGGRLILMWPDDLDEELGEVIVPETLITQAQELSGARHRLGALLEPMTGDADSALLAISEGMTNMLKHGDGGTYTLRRTEDVVQIVLTDHGPGIDFHSLPKATLVPGFSTKPSLGMGFTIMLEVAERLRLTTQPGRTTLVLEFGVSPVPSQRWQPG